MKKLLILIVYVLVAAALAACGAAPVSIATAAPGSPLTQADLQFPADGQRFALKTDIAPLLAVLGDGYELSSAISCVFDGEDKTYDYGGVILYTYPQGDVDILDEIIAYDPAYPTARGVKVGDSRQQVIDAYGDNFVDDNGVLTYVLGDADNLANPRLLFEIVDGQVASIDYYHPSNID